MGFDASTPAREGLSSAAAELRLAEVGPNEPAPVRRRSAVSEVLLLLANPLAIVLLVASVVSAFLGQLADAGLIVTMVLLSVLVNFAQTYRSQRAADALRAGVAPTATVRRDGQWRELPRRDVVPGDLVRVAAGDLVPADARLVDARDLHVQESALTGESLPVEKAPASEETPSSTIRLGTSVVSGTATAIVTATGVRTTFGDIARRLAARPPETEFERGLRQFGLLITRAILFLVLFIAVVSIAMHRDAFQSLLFAVALAVGLTPEFLPMISTVTLAKGAVRMAQSKVIVKHLAAIQNLGSIDVLCSDKTGTLTAGEMRVAHAWNPFGAPSNRPLALAACNSAFESGIKSPLDAAILAAWPEGAGAYRKRDEIPFDFERRRLSIVVDAPGEAPLLVTKGALESVLACATHVDEAGVVRPLTDADRAQGRRVCERFGDEGLRVLAVASRRMDARAAYTAADERDLVLEGFISFADPPLSDAAEAITALARDGVRVKILTGDDDRVARHVCGEVGLDVGAIVLGDAIARMTDAALGHVAERTTVFARVSPAQKNRILLALKRRGHVVGYLGDGINDAPSLHTADVGISVATAVDVARDAADIVLLERSLRAIHVGILEGRAAFANVTKYLLMGTSSNFGNMLSMAAASLFLPFLPMLPTQILLNNLLYDVAQVTIPTDRVDDAYVRAPQRWDLAVLRRFMLLIGPLSSIYDFLTFFVLLRVFHAGEPLFHTGWFVESLATQTLVLFVIRTRESPLRSRPSAPLAATALGVVGLAVALPFTPIAHALGFVPLPWPFFLFVALATVTYLGLVEAVKRHVLAPPAVRATVANARARPLPMDG